MENKKLKIYKRMLHWEHELNKAEEARKNFTDPLEKRRKKNRLTRADKALIWHKKKREKKCLRRFKEAFKQFSALT